MKNLLQSMFCWQLSLLICLPALCLGSWCPGSAAEAQEETPDHSASQNPAQLFEPREFADDQGNILRYRLLKPLDYDPTERYPLLIFLHGAGERGSDNLAQLKHGMAELCRPERRSANPCYVLAPQCPTDQQWADVDWTTTAVVMPDDPTTSMKLLFQVVDQMLADSPIDKNRVYLSGLSMGGFGTWDACCRRPDFFAAAVPICGGADPSTADTLKDLPIWCFHGENDKVVSVDLSRKMIGALKNWGGKPKYTEYPGVGHDAWSETYANDDVYAWLFSQRRRSAPGR